MKKHKYAVAAFIFILFVLFYCFGRSFWYPQYLKLRGPQTVQDVIVRYEKSAEARLCPYFEAAEIGYPPAKITLIAFKDKKVMDLWAAAAGEDFRLVHTYAIKGASGTTGPKLREGDRQVPEGLYRIVGLNPNSSYHLSLKLNYPNAFDLKHAELESRDNPGSNIFIHGKSNSIGCLAMGDRAIEEIFVLAQKVGLENITVIIAPMKPSSDFSGLLQGQPDWVGDLYGEIQACLEQYYGR